MALVINNSATVATGMSPVVESALYADEVFIDGVTFSSRYEIAAAGQIQVEKYSPDNTVEAKVPGASFTDSEYQNTVVNINTNNGFQKSAKVPAYYQASMPTSVLANKTWDTTEAVRVGRQKAGLAVLVDKGQPGDSDDALTVANIKKNILADRAVMRKKHARPNVVLCTVDTYSAVLEAAGKDFTPGYNDEVVRTGRIGYWMGMLFIESSALSQGASFSYLSEQGAKQTVDTQDVDYIMYDYNAFSIIDRLVMLRVIDSEQFAGSKVQMEVDTGFAVTNEDCVVVRKHSAA